MAPAVPVERRAIAVGAGDAGGGGIDGVLVERAGGVGDEGTPGVGHVPVSVGMTGSVPKVRVASR
jgi:hypothetical protein